MTCATPSPCAAPSTSSRRSRRSTSAAWVDIDYTANGVAQVAETTLAGRRLIVRRTRITGRQAQLFPDWRHHAFVTDRPGTAVELDADHRHHAVVEPAIRDLITSRRARPLPVGIFNTNAAWLVLATLATLAHNVPAPTARLGAITDTGLVVAKTIRRRLFTIPGRLTRSARRCTCPSAVHGPTWCPMRI